MENAPAVSVIIPMYDVEKFIGDCLDSLLAQKFQNYEVILVNDCSTDNSRQIAETYPEKFGGRLKIYHNEENLGAGASRNKGLRLSNGKYVFFMDSDDTLIQQALGEMYFFAKNYNADVVNCTKFYRMNVDGKETVLNTVNDKIERTVIEEDIEQRVETLLRNKLGWGIWLRFLRRDFLLQNQIFFIEDLEWGEDQVWTYGLLCAKKVLHVPQAYYCKRKYSSTWKKRYYHQNLNVRYRALIKGLKWIDNMLEKSEYFQQNLQFRHKILDHFTRNSYSEIFKHSLQKTQSKIYDSLKQEFGKDFGDYDVLIPTLLTLVNTNQKEIDNLKKKLTNK